MLAALARPGDIVVEFCAGSGYVALPLACMFPQCTFVLLDKKEPSLAIGTHATDFEHSCCEYGVADAMFLQRRSALRLQDYATSRFSAASSMVRLEIRVAVQ